MIYITDIYLRNDYTELITESFVKKYDVDTSTWILPYAYYDEFNGSIVSNSGIPDGSYLAVGTFTYPANKGLERHIIGQFNLCKSLGMDLTWLKAFNPYPSLPKALRGLTQPIYPLFRVGTCSDYKKARTIVSSIDSRHWHLDELDKAAKKKPITSLEGTIYRIRLALQRQLLKD